MDEEHDVQRSLGRLEWQMKQVAAQLAELRRTLDALLLDRVPVVPRECPPDTRRSRSREKTSKSAAAAIAAWVLALCWLMVAPPMSWVGFGALAPRPPLPRRVHGV